MSDASMNVFDGKTFKSGDYVRNLVQECVGSAELLQKKAKIQQYSDQTSSSLKKHVYENYMQFIETAKEITHLESEMYQLSHILIEQRNLLSTLREGSVLDEPPSMSVEEDTSKINAQSIPREDLQNKKTIDIIKESLIGFKGNLDSKLFIHEGGLIELDANDYRPICRTHLFLFNDTLIISKVKYDKKLEFIAEYETKNLAVINIRDLDGVKNAINIITTDGSRIFQCTHPAAKAEWIEKFEISMKSNQRNKYKKRVAPSPPIQQKSLTETNSISSISTLSPTSETVPVNNVPDWLNFAPEEIQALIAQRHFEDALTLIQKCEEFMEKDNKFTNLAEIKEKVKSLKVSLTSVLLLELSHCQSRSLQAALRSSRRPLKLLAEMKKAREACGTLLTVCTTAIRQAQRQARRNNLDISELFFCDLAQVASEFLRAFNSQAACTSALVVWCNMELQYFASQLIKHYLTKDTPLETVAKCVEKVRVPCAKLTLIGLDLSYYMEGLLRSTLENVIDDSRYRLTKTISRNEEIWQPYNLQTKSNLKNTLRDLNNLGIDLKTQVTGDTWINLTQSTVNFIRQFLILTESCATLAKNETLKVDSELLLKEVFLAQYNAKPSATMNVDLNFVARNKNYLLETLLPIAMKKFEVTCGAKCEVLSELASQQTPPKPKPRSIYQTDVL